ncbi:MAG TPA: GNAT family N-acetyltransferase [Firmicutes bacterium]|mgnify:FL=1|jgi:ribosomal protein S18 acetylase RimI-like enzyme|nr:GNAT family N-acetyltransferase [Bacillota bacterium]HBE07233.1 GNAT family N-acetyltransferase [Bacillota bacterium]HBG44483.1 GNAT family N-acetyltransferase [Bacillota bacterium]HBL68652.1 GNAT family N-acetyltransferase [Bacillota bacterium]HBR23254.1 GNAT family N-acetyltransferase [Bacillota bacterium]
MNIREMTMADYDAVFQLWVGTEGVGLRRLDDSPAGIAKFLDRNPKTNFVAEIDQKIIGIALSGNDGRRGYLYHMAVSPDYRRQGIGKALLQAICTAMKNEGINKMALVVFSKNQIGNGFWQSQGWRHRTDLIYRDLSLSDENVLIEI